MIKSMTAYASAESNENELSVSVEIRSYNNKYLDIVLRLPRGYVEMEEKIKSLVQEKVSRGRIEIGLKMTDLSEEAYEYEVDEIKAKAYYKALNKLQETLDMSSEIPVNIVSGFNGIIRPADMNKDLDVKWPAVRDCISRAVDGLNDMRAKEGEFIAKDFEARLDFIEECVEKIEKESGGLIELYQERLKNRISVLTRDTIEIDQGRIAQEAAFLADRSDISEEVVRAKSHAQQFRDIMAGEEPAGRKLNFLLQEFNREFNTVGSKVGKSEISHIVVDLKSELEKIREQVQNIE